MSKKLKYHEVKMNERQAKKWTKSSIKFFRWLENHGFNIDDNAPDIEQVVQDGKCYVVFRQVEEAHDD